MLRSVAPIRPGALVEGEGGGSGGVGVVLRRWMCEDHRFDEVWPVVLVTREENMQIPPIQQKHATFVTTPLTGESPENKQSKTYRLQD